MRITTAARRLLVLALSAMGLLVVLASAAAASTATSEQSLAEKINVERRNAGKPTLVVNVQLTRVARAWTGQMAKTSTLAHNPKLADQVPAGWQGLGENVGWTKKTGASSEQLVQRLHDAYMNSAGHRANVLGDYNQVGVGITVNPDGTMWSTVAFMKAQGLPPSAQVAEGVRVSRQVFPAPSQSPTAVLGDPSYAAAAPARHVVLGRADVFADALGGAGLAGDDGPVLFTPGPTPADSDPVLHPETRAEIDRVLNGRGTVYLLGGTSAVSGAVERELVAGGYDVRRLAGPSRVETSVKVAEEVVARRGVPAEVILARADDWADAVSGGAYAAASGAPVLLTGRGELHPAVASFLSAQGSAKRWALGGSAALSDGVVAKAGATRVAGPDRTATAVQVAIQLWGRTTSASGDTFVATPGYRADGWAFSLAYAPLSAARKGPQLLVGDDVSPAVRDYLMSLRYGNGKTGALEAASPVPAGVSQQVRALLGG